MADKFLESRVKELTADLKKYTSAANNLDRVIEGVITLLGQSDRNPLFENIQDLLRLGRNGAWAKANQESSELRQKLFETK